ncbi:MAG: peptidoglycan editing factor PgeF [Cyanobacteria bacterium P01_G01_bin.54]
MNPFCDPDHPAPQWQWLTLAGQPYLTCDLLADWSHGFFTQQFYPTPPEAISQRLVPEAAAYRVKQVHGNVALTPTTIAAHSGEEPPPADGVVTEALQQSAWVASADCTPVLIGDVVTGRVAAIHSGWRGTAQRIVPKTITQLLAMGSQLQNLRLAMGPAIQGQVYQVGEQVGQEVARSVVADPDPDTDYLQQAMALVEPALFSDEHPGRVRLDVRRIISLQLQDMGVAFQNVAIAPCCTYQQPDLFFSYRRTKEKKVQWSGIVGQ